MTFKKKLDQQPDFAAIEKRTQKFWEKEEIYKFNPDSGKPIFSVDVPPVYASAGHLHIGHALHYTQLEIPTRFFRMNGCEIYFPPCFDDNGLPTEKMVEEKYNINKASTTKSAFRKLCIKESKLVEKAYSDRVYKKLGHGYDWSLLYTTINPSAQKVAQASFLDLIKKKLAYRAEEPTLWCTYHQTALAQAEVEDKARDTFLNYIYFDLENGGKIEIATSRPEFLPACVGIFVHPEDERYKKLIGKHAIVPLFKQKVKILADAKVDPNFGSGIVMVCTFGDNTDIEWWKLHKLELRIIVNKDGTLNELAGKYAGLRLNEAKEKVLEDLKAEGAFIRQELLKQTVGVCWRCSTPVEFIVTKQWFIQLLQNKEAFIKQGQKVKWHPEFYRKRYEDWVNNLNWDWCISRQRFFGVPIPVWYCAKCNEPTFPELTDLPIDPTKDKPKKNKCKCGSEKFVPEEDVFDTWMTSSVSPQVASKCYDQPTWYKKIYPMSLRPQSHDIIRTWAFYTIVKSWYHEKSIPWKNIMLGTFVLDSHGHGMHKSKGNAIWFDDIIGKYNVDAFRYWVATANIGEDMPFQEKEIVRGNKIILKLWNTARFAEMNSAHLPKIAPELELVDKWIYSRLAEVMKTYKNYFESFEMGKARKELEMFFLHEFCDNYLEMIKYRIYGTDDKSKKAAVWTFYNVLLEILKMWAPIIPHITEEIYQVVYKKHFWQAKSIHIKQFAKLDEPDKKLLEDGKMALEAIALIRKYKQDNQIKLGDKMEKISLQAPHPTELRRMEDVIKGTMRLNQLHIEKGEALKVC